MGLLPATVSDWTLSPGPSMLQLLDGSLLRAFADAAFYTGVKTRAAFYSIVKSRAGFHTIYAGFHTRVKSRAGFRSFFFST